MLDRSSGGQIKSRFDLNRDLRPVAIRFGAREIRFATRRFGFDSISHFWRFDLTSSDLEIKSQNAAIRWTTKTSTKDVFTIQY